MEFDGARVVIAGATGSVGSAVAARLRERGAAVGAVVRDPGRLDAGGPAAPFDARDLASCAAAVDAVAAGLGGLDLAFVAIGAPAFGDVPDAVAADLMTVNAVAPIALLRAATRHLPAGGGGTLAAVTAIVAEHPTAGMAAYSASKAALSAYLTALRREVRKRRITVLDARLPHLETDFATRTLHGEPPALPAGMALDDAADALVDALAADRRELAYDLEARSLTAR